jgi:hypothetical protein
VTERGSAALLLATLACMRSGLTAALVFVSMLLLQSTGGVLELMYYNVHGNCRSLPLPVVPQCGDTSAALLHVIVSMQGRRHEWLATADLGPLGGQVVSNNASSEPVEPIRLGREGCTGTLDDRVGCKVASPDCLQQVLASHNLGQEACARCTNSIA